ncbi:DUF5689 domain-containing protein [Mucilaginibacter terrae]|uniref:DUF5689 domain-containing protein n=1 Tax=Mucilaginibacter terrae TaxID=1955052 RepID=UPI003632ADF2
MKKIYIYFLLVVCAGFNACQKDKYPGATLSPIIAVYDLRAIYKGADVVLNEENMNGASKIVGTVISDATSGNAPAGVLVVQNERRLGIRGISLAIGAAATKFVPGDSVAIQVTGATLGRVNGSLQIKGVNEAAITKVASAVAHKLRVVPSNLIIANPDAYESTLVSVSNAVTEPEPKPGDTYAGDKIINDSFGKLTLHTETTATFAGADLPASANFTGIPVVVTSGTVTSVQIWPRVLDDAFPLPLIKPSPFIISGYLTDPSGGDGNQEYIQFLATKDINFSETNFSVVTTNNAGTNPAPQYGWAVGLARTYKINLTSGTVKKGQFFYVGGNKNIWGSTSTDISAANWISSTQYANVNGADFGTATANLLANSGNVAGIGVFAGIVVDVNTTPLDVIMYGGNGTVYAAGPPEIGYRITNTDYYSTINAGTRKTQNFYGAGTNTSKLVLPATGNFSKLGGVYDALTGRWTTGRTVTSIPLTTTSPLSTIEVGTGFTTLVN